MCHEGCQDCCGCEAEISSLKNLLKSACEALDWSITAMSDSAKAAKMNLIEEIPVIKEANRVLTTIRTALEK